MTGSTRPDVFVDLLDATVRGSRNYHRLEHLGRRTDYTLKEETITDLLLAEMAGRSYEVTAGCPGCDPGRNCRHWEGGRQPDAAGVRLRALTKAQEGGNRSTGQQGANADFVLSVVHADPDDPDPADAPQFRLLVQAKRAAPGGRFLNTKDRGQYDRLLVAATDHGAVPYYALYVQQPGPHGSSPTRCGRHKTAADRSVVLVPAGPGSLYGAVKDGTVDEALARGRPLRCLAGCTCSGSTAKAAAFDAVRAFVQTDFPGYNGTGTGIELPRGVASTAINDARWRPGAGPPVLPPAADGDPEDQGEETLLVVRLGQQEPSPESGREWIGYAPGMDDADIREAARRYWRLDPLRARRIRYLVAASGRDALAAFAVTPDSLTYTVGSSGIRRAAFELVPVPDPRLRARLLDLAGTALARLRSGARNPVLYVDGPP